MYSTPSATASCSSCALVTTVRPPDPSATCRSWRLHAWPVVSPCIAQSRVIKPGTATRTAPACTRRGVAGALAACMREPGGAS